MDRRKLCEAYWGPCIFVALIWTVMRTKPPMPGPDISFSEYLLQDSRVMQGKRVNDRLLAPFCFRFHVLQCKVAESTLLAICLNA